MSTQFDQAQALHRNGRLAEARAIYERILATDPRHFGALHFLGLVAAQTGDPARGVELMARSLALNGTHAMAFNNYGNVLAQLERHEAALQAYDRAVALAPNYADAHYNRGIACFALKRFEESVRCYEQALQLAPRSVDALFNRGIVKYRLERFESALADFSAAVALDPGHAKAHANRGLVLHRMKSAEAALECLDRALALQPALPEAHSNRGNVLRDLRRPDAAIAAYDRAISLQPTFAEAHYNRGIALRDLRQHAAAIIDFEKAIALRPGYVEALNALGNAHLDLGAVSAAIESYAAAAALDPSFRFLLGVLRHARMKICDWNEWQADLEAIVAGIAAGRAVAPPFAVLGLVDSPRLHAKTAEIWVQHEFPASARLGPLPARARHDRIRLAYVSGDFRDHPVAALTVELIEIHDRGRFEVIGISHGARAQDELSLRIEGAFDRFIDVRDQSDVEIAGLLRELEIDIAVDLGGFTQGSRPGVFALRAAPVQIGYLGYLGTLSAEYMDYLVADETIIPSSDAVLYRERIIWLPSYQVNDSKRRMAERRFTRADCGLPPEGFVFCCFNAPYKLTPETFSSWMRILARAERSVLFLYCDDASAAANLGRAAEQRGIDPNRLIFGGRLSRPEYLARYLVADLFLDTLPYNAGTTASDALWAGLPVLTVMGKAFAGRVAASVLQAAGLPELVTRTPCEYEDKAVELATDPSLLARIRLRLEQNRRTTPLFDTPSFARSLETAYRIIDERRLAGLPLDHVRREEISSRLATTSS